MDCEHAHQWDALIEFATHVTYSHVMSYVKCIKMYTHVGTCEDLTLRNM
jgi:hypothetical protein